MIIKLDTDNDTIIVANSFYKQIDKMNEAVAFAGGTKIDYTDFIKQHFNKAIENPVVRQMDIKK